MTVQPTPAVLAMVAVPDESAVLEFLQWPQSDPDMQTLAGSHLLVVVGLVSAYTRGRGFSTDGLQCAPGIASVITSATARSMANPAQSGRVEAGSYSEYFSAPLTSFSLAEQQTLNLFRKRTG